jgi:hypothetical protein
MTDSANFAPKMIHPEQVSEQKAPEKPWLRQRNEPAAWYMRFKRYLDLGPKRSLRALVAGEPDTQKATKGTEKNQETKKMSDVSVPGAWKRASKVWRWVERAEAYDLAEQAREAVKMREYAGSLQFSSRAYRLVQLNYAAMVLKQCLESWRAVPHDQMKDYLALIARYQSVMRDIEASMQGLDVANDIIDAAAMYEVEKEMIEYKYERKLREATPSKVEILTGEKQKELKELKKKHGQ